jgi:hypothetical protein
MDAYKRQLRGRYVDAFRGFHIDEMVGLLHKDAVQSMPPCAMWVIGSKDIGRLEHSLESWESGVQFVVAGGAVHAARLVVSDKDFVYVGVQPEQGQKTALPPPLQS